jgi:hypothetical protein
MNVFSRFQVLSGLICALVLAGVSCSLEETIQVLGTSSQTPVFLGAKAVSALGLEFQFSLPVRVLSFAAEPPMPVEAIEDGETVQVKLAGSIPGGELYTVDLLVEDEQGNTLNILVPLRSRNERMPRLIINELRTEYSSPRSEFVEFKTLEAGNLGGLRLIIVGNYKNPLVFEFPPVETAADEYLVLHLRTLSTDTGAVNETGDDLGLSGGTDTKPGARDFWIPGTDKLLHKTDVLYLLDQDDKVVDGVMLSEIPDPWWTKDYFVEAADLLYGEGAWSSTIGELPGPVDAVITTSVKTAATRSVSRDETVPDSNTQDDWYVTATSSSKPGATPGAPNNPIREP